MATARFNATALVLSVNGSPVAHATGGTLNINQDLLDASTKDSARWKEQIRGARDWSIDIEGMIDYTASFGVDELADLIISGVSAEIAFATSETGDTKYTGTVDLSGLTQDAPSEGMATFSGTLVGTGVLTKTTVA